jgi:spore coat polysaccharide biosynthesis protein SpsF
MPLPFLAGKPVIKWIIDEIGLTAYNGVVIVATSENPENDILIEYCKLNLVKYYRGNEDNVLSRFISIVKEDSYDAVVRLTSDNPLIDIFVLDKAIAYHIDNCNDYTRTEDMPLGMNYEIISPKALLFLEKSATSDYDKEHVTPFIRNSTSFKKNEFIFGANEYLKNIRVTIDYPSDFLLLSAIVAVGLKLNIKGLELIEKIFLDFPWIFEANNSNIQKKKYNTLRDELTAAASILKKFELGNIADILNDYEKKLQV